MTKQFAIICNAYEHAIKLVLEPYHIPRDEVVIITPERTTLIYGYKDLAYYAMRPLYAREKSYIGNNASLEDIKEKDQYLMGKKYIRENDVRWYQNEILEEWREVEE